MIVLVSGLVACDAHLVPTAHRPPSLQGTVWWTRTSLRTAATIEDLQSGGTVSLVDPTTHQTIEATQATSGTGAFSFPFTTATLSPGYYWLEAARFISGPRHAGVTLRTILHYTGSGWDSISGTDVQISPLTTAIARVRALDPAVTDAATIGAVVPPHQVVAPLVTYSPAVLDQLAAEIALVVAGGGDGAGDLPLPATITPTTGTPGITQLKWTGIPLEFDFHTQVASGTDGLGTAQVEMSPAALGAFGWTSTAPSGLVGPVQVRLQTGTARTLAQTWTPLTASILGSTAVSQLVTADGPSGPLAAWKGADNRIRVASIGVAGLEQTDVLGTGGDELAVGSSDSGMKHVIAVTAGVPYHFRSLSGATWSTPELMSVATATISNPTLASDGQGGLWAAWLIGAVDGFDLQVSRWTGAGWQPVEVVANRVESFALTGGPEPQLAWISPEATGSLLKYSRRAFGHWDTPTTLSVSGRDVSDPVLTLDAAGLPHVLWLDRTTVASGQKAAMLAFRALQGGAWTAEERFTPSVVPSVSRHGLTVDPNGVPLAYWQNGTSPGLVQISRRTASMVSPGSWGKPITLDRAGASGLAGVAMADRLWLLWMTGSSSTLQGIPVVW